MKTKKFKHVWKRMVSMLMAAVLLVSMVPLPESSAKEATPTDAEPKEGRLSVSADVLSDMDVSGVWYKVFYDAACKKEAAELVLSADGNAYADADGEPVVYTDTASSGAEPVVLSLEEGTYYLQMKKQLYKSSQMVEERGITYAFEPESIQVAAGKTTKHKVVLSKLPAEDAEEQATEEVVAEAETRTETEPATPADAAEEQTEETAGTEEALKATEAEPATPADAESRTEQTLVTTTYESALKMVSTLMLFSSGSKVYYMYGGFRAYNMYDASGNFVKKAYCGWQYAWEPIPSRGITAANKLKVTEGIETNAGIRKILYYGPDSEAMSLYLDNYNTRYRGWKNAGISGGYSNAVDAILAKDAPLTTAQAEISLNKKTVTTTVDGTNLKSAEVTVSGGNGGNTFVFKVPSGLTCFVKKDGKNTYTKHAAKSSVTVGVGDSFYFTAKSSDKFGANDTTVSLSATKEGFDAYHYVPDDPDVWQTFYYGAEPETYSAKLKIEWLDAEEGYFMLNKKAAGDITVDYSQYNMAGIQYGIYADKNKTTASDREPSDAHENIPAGIKKLVLSYNGYAYMDDDGKNVVFYDEASKEAYEDSGRKLSKMKWYKQVAKDTSFYYKEVGTLLKKGETNNYYYTGKGVSDATKAAITAHAGKSISYTGYKLDGSAHKFTLTTSGDGTKVIETTEDDTVKGSVTLNKTLNGSHTSAVEGLVFKLYHVEKSGDTYDSEGAYKIGEFTANASGNCVPTLLTKKAENRGITKTSNSFQNVPLGWYYIVETSDSVTALGFVNDLVQRSQWKEITTDGATADFTLNNTTEGKTKVTKSYPGSARELAGVKFNLYKVSGNGGAYSNDNLVADFIHNGTKVVPNKVNPTNDRNLNIGITIGTGADADYFTNIPYGWYCLVEDTATATERGFAPAAPVYLQCSEGNKTLNFQLKNERSGLMLQKQFEDTPMNQLCSYSLEGAEYVVYRTIAKDVVPSFSPENYVATFKTDADGAGYVFDYNKEKYYSTANVKNGKAYKLVGVPLNTWLYVKETKASEGCALDETAYFLYFTADNMNQKVTSTEPLKNDPIRIQIQKEDSTSGANVGAASLAGAEFTVKYFDVNVSGSVDKDAIYESVKTMVPTRTWVYKTDETGKVDMHDSSYLVTEKSDELYYSNERRPTFPYGAVTIEETKAPDGYTVSGPFTNKEGAVVSDSENVIFMVIKDGVSAETVLGSNTIIKEEVALRADIKFKKVALDTGKPLSGIAFKITSKTTGESHVVVTDKNGMIDTSKIKHSKNTNAADKDNKTVSGTWFYGNKEASGTVDDTLGALPYDVYEIEELAIEGNEEYRLITPVTVDLTKNDYKDGYQLYDFGTVTNIPEPYLETRALGVSTQDNIIPADAKVDVVDIADYYYLEAGKTYTLKGIIMNPETGKAYVQPDGTYSTGVKTFTVPDDETGYTTANVSIPFVIDTTGLAGKNIVVAEYLFEGTDTSELVVKEDGTIDETNVYKTHTGKLVKHDDLTAKSQTLSIPKIGTTLTDKETGDHISYADSDVTLVDTVSYKNLIVGKEYTVKGVLMDKETGKKLTDADGKEIAAETTFIVATESGTVEAVFSFNGSLLAGKSMVAFETITYKGVEIAVHADITDSGQTVDFPEIGTTLVDSKTGTHEAKAESKVTLIDTVSYKNLVVGKEYTVKGILMDKETGKKLTDADGNEVTSEVCFTAETKTGSIDISFTFDGTNLAGKSVVAFETVTYKGVEIAVHADISDSGQTVDFPKVPDTPDTPNTPGPKTGDTTPVPMLIGLMIFCLLGACAVLIKKKKLKKELK